MDPEPQQKEPTPEERLFKIIQESEKAAGAKEDTLIVPAGNHAEAELEEAPADSGGPREATQASRVVEHGSEVFAKKAMRATEENYFEKVFTKKAVSIKTANRALVLVLCVLIAYFVATQFFLRESRQGDFLKKAMVTGAPLLDLPPDFFAFDWHKEVYENRNVFQPWRPPLPPPPPEPAAAQAAAAPEALSGNFKLTGIYLGASPEALIEALDEKKTYTVSRGSTIKGYKVKDVRENEVILSDGGADKVLSLQ